MGRHAEDFLLKKEEKSPYWYYRLKGWKSFKSTKKKTKAAAMKVALSAWQEVQDGRHSHQEMNFGTYANDFFAQDSSWCQRQFAKGRLQSSTAEWRERLLSNHILPRFQKYEISQITPSSVDNWLLSHNNVSDRTKEHIRTTFRIVLKEAKRDGIIQSNPINYVEPINVIGSTNEPPTMDELRKLFPIEMDSFREIWPNVRNRQFPRPYEYSEVPCTISARRITAWKQKTFGYRDLKNGKRAV